MQRAKLCKGLQQKLATVEDGARRLTLKAPETTAGATDEEVEAVGQFVGTQNARMPLLVAIMNVPADVETLEKGESGSGFDAEARSGGLGEGERETRTESEREW